MKIRDALSDRKELFIPKRFHIETTNFCNAKCIMCPHEKMNREKGYMSWKLFKKIIKECKALEIKGLKFHLHKDGEPLMDVLLFKRIKYIKKNLPNSRIRFNSNAMLLDEKKAKQLLNSEVDEVVFSIDGASKETYESIRKGLKYDIVKRNLDRFFKLKKDSSNKMNIIMQMVVCEENKHEIKKYRNLWSEKALVFFKSMHNFMDMNTSIKTKKLSKKQLRLCKQPFNYMMISWNGDVGLCCWDYDNITNLGNIKKDNLIGVYNNDKFKTIRDSMKMMDCSKIIPCKECSQIYGHDMDKDFSESR
jgi:MoaA/NifB/PqqE/SkfB family radical SAM enzyme